MRLLLIAAVVTACSVGQSAQADWLATAKGPDVFGNTTVTAANPERLSDSLIVQCDQGNQLEIAYIVRIPQSDDVQANVGAELLIQTASGAAPMKLDAELQKWNGDYAGFVADGRTEAMVAAVRAIGNATGTINVGVVVGGRRLSASFSAVGSTAAMNTVIKDCKLGEIAPSTPAAPSG